MTAARPLLGLLLRALPLLVLCAGTGHAQTTVNPGALDQLAPPPATPSAPKHTTTRHTPRPARGTSRAAPHGTAKTEPHAPARPAARAPARPAMPTVPAVAPPAPVLPPPIVVPTRPPPPPEPVPVARDAPGAALLEKDGLRITFGVGRADLNPASDAAVQALARGLPASAHPTFSVTAYAAGNADDPSTPRRLSLDRALAIRSILMRQGVPSERIYVKAMGPPPDGSDLSPDRVDITVARAPPATQPTQPTPPEGATAPARPFVPPTRTP